MTLHKQNEQPDGTQRLALGLGWLSIGLGVAQLAVPRHVARLIGAGEARYTCGAVRAVGVRELACGVGILGSRGNSSRGLWLRLAGDFLDVALLSAALRSSRSEPERVVTAIAAVLGISALDGVAARRLQRSTGRARDRAQEVTRTVTINRRPEEVYDFWRDLVNLPQFMVHVRSIERIDERRSRWSVAGPAGKRFEWEAEITDDRPGERIAWRTVGDADVEHTGSVDFTAAPGGRGTEVRVHMRYDSPGGRLGTVLASLIGRAPGQEAESDLRRLKQVLEAGEVLHSDASIHRGPHPARPAREHRRLREPERSGRIREEVGERPEWAHGFRENMR